LGFGLQRLYVTLGSGLDEERKGLEQERRLHVSHFENASKHVQAVLVPRTHKAWADIQKLLDTRRSLERAKHLINQLSTLRAKKAVLAEPPPKATKRPSLAEVRTNETAGLCRQVEKLLDEWHYPDAGPVEFSELDQDILIDGRQRKSPGKGFRALSYSAFIIALMKYCYAARLPHPGFVVIDSPLVAYKHPEAGEESIKKNDVKDAFYRTLAKTPQDEQIVIIENQDPPSDIINAIHHTHFTRVHGENRYGFFPVATPPKPRKRAVDWSGGF
jgi:hypothetical protein